VVRDEVMRLAQAAADAGAHGVVCSGAEAAELRDATASGWRGWCPASAWRAARRTTRRAWSRRAGGGGGRELRRDRAAVTAADDPAAAMAAVHAALGGAAAGR
jgi:orotidine-5'-phosphate decarboxylase